MELAQNRVKVESFGIICIGTSGFVTKDFYTYGEEESDVNGIPDAALKRLYILWKVIVVVIGIAVVVAGLVVAGEVVASVVFLIAAIVVTIVIALAVVVVRVALAVLVGTHRYFLSVGVPQVGIVRCLEQNLTQWNLLQVAWHLQWHLNIKY
jgi:hypothetical protein